MGKLYGGILIYEIWKTTRFSNLEILAKMEQEMACKLEKDQIVGDKSSTNSLKDSIKTEETVHVTDNLVGEQQVERREPAAAQTVIDNEELREEEYDQYNDDPSYNNMQREYYNQRFGGLRNRRVLETHSRSLEEKPYYKVENT